MSDKLKDREAGEELKFKMSADLEFKASARRNKLLGLWLAEKFGYKADAANAYAREVVMADLDEPGIEDVVRKVMADIKARKVRVSEADVRKKIVELYSIAIEQVKAEA